MEKLNGEKLFTAGGAGGRGAAARREPNLSEQERQRRVGEDSVVGVDSGEENPDFLHPKQRVKNQRVTKTAFQPSSSFLFLFAC